MLTYAEAQADRPRYACVRCSRSLTAAQAWYSPTGQHAGPGYYCETHAPADARAVATDTTTVTP